MEGVLLPSSLQSLKFGDDFNQSLEGVTFPSGLQSLTFGSKFNQRLNGVSLPSGLHSELDVWLQVQPETGRSELAKWASDLVTSHTKPFKN
jgi:hypothetical protein